jgi:Fe-S-cluster formation regulator IscX/YfhJ
MSTNTTMQQNDTSDKDFTAALPEWKRALWHGISAAAHARNAFDNDDYDINGDLNPSSARFAELCTWLVCLTEFAPAARRTTKRSCRVLTNMLADCTTHRSEI